ncbi:MAG: restriction endonuclease subunit S [Candidatus Absconditabacterales bacterium]
MTPTTQDTDFIRGQLPSGWTETTLGEATKIMSGSTPSTKNGSYRDGNIVRITPKDLSSHNSVYITKGERNITKEGLVNSSAQLLPKNAILFSSRAPIGYVAIAGTELTTNQGFKNVVCDERESHFKFFYYLLKNKAEYIEKMSSGSTFSEASATVMRSVTISLPPLPEQQAIAAVLSSFDDKIELLREENKTLEATAQGIFKEWFGKYKVDDELPKGWRVGKLGEEFDILMGQSPAGESYNENKEGMVFFQGRTDFTERFPTTRLHTTEPKRIANKFDVLVSVRAPVGDINIATETCCIGRGLAAVKSDNKSYCLYKIKSLKECFDAFETEGTVFGSINKDSFKNIEVIIPSGDFTKKFESIAHPMDLKIFNNYQQVQSLSKTRDELLPKLMSGEVRVKF